MQSKQIVVRMPKGLIARLESAAAIEANSVSALVRRLVSSGLTADNKPAREIEA